MTDNINTYEFLKGSPLDTNRVDALMDRLFPEIRKLAHAQLRKERRDMTLNTTAIVNEVYIKFRDTEDLQWIDKAHFLALCSMQIRRILVDYARKKSSMKRGGDRVQVTLHEEEQVDNKPAIDILSLHQAMKQLREKDPELEQLVLYRYFGGLKIAELAKVLDTSESTVKRQLAQALSELILALGR